MQLRGLLNKIYVFLCVMCIGLFLKDMISFVVTIVAKFLVITPFTEMYPFVISFSACRREHR
jgi:hypothetical protein